MRYLAGLCCLLISMGAFARTPLWRDVQDLKRRVEALEKKLNQPKKVDAKTGLKVKDMKQEQMGGASRSTADASGSQLTSQQQKELQQNIEKIKKNQKDSHKLIEQIMNENP